MHLANEWRPVYYAETGHYEGSATPLACSSLRGSFGFGVLVFLRRLHFRHLRFRNRSRGGAGSFHR